MVTARTGIERCAATPAMVAAMRACVGSSGTSKGPPWTRQELLPGGRNCRCIALEIARAAMMSTMAMTAAAPARIDRAAATHQKVPVIRHPIGSVSMDTMPAAPTVSSALPERIDQLWEVRDSLTPADTSARDAITAAVDLIDSGQVRVAWLHPDSDVVVVDER